MAQTSINIRTDENLKKQFDEICEQMGLNLSAAMNIYMKAVVRQRGIPFKIIADTPSFMVSTKEDLNMKIMQGLSEFDAGKGRLAEDFFSEYEKI